MAQITINEVSQNYTYNIGNNTFATVALPITASWGPCIKEYADDRSEKDILDVAYWSRFPATQAGLESFVSTYRGPASVSKLYNDYSYQQAMTLLTAGYDVLVCRLCPGIEADNYFVAKEGSDAKAALKIIAKYPGTFGNNIGVSIAQKQTWNVAKQGYIPFWNIIVYTINEYGNSTPVENLSFTFIEEDVSDSLIFVDDITSNFIDIDGDAIVEAIINHDLSTTLTNGKLSWAFAGDDSYKILGGDAAVRLGKDYTIGYGDLAAVKGTDKAEDISIDVDSLIRTYGTNANSHLPKDPVIIAESRGYSDNDDYISALSAFSGVIWGNPVADNAYPTAPATDKTLTIDLDATTSPITINTSTGVPSQFIQQGNNDPTSETAVDTGAIYYYSKATDHYFDLADSTHWNTTALTQAPYTNGQLIVINDSDVYTLYQFNYNVEASTVNTFASISVVVDGDWLKNLSNGDTFKVTIQPAVVDPATPERAVFAFIGRRLGAADSGHFNTVNYNKEIYRQWVYTWAYKTYDLLTDKLAYNPQRIISPGWDDQNVLDYTDDLTGYDWVISPLHKKILDVAFHSRCATGLLDVPKGLPKSKVDVKDVKDTNYPGYAQIINELDKAKYDVLYTSHSTLITPWAHYQYVGTGRQSVASPAFRFLLIQRAMLLNQAVQYEWALPTNRKTNLTFGKADYEIGKHYLDIWQSNEGVNVNCITTVPDLGLTIWGNSTLFDVPPATYNALQNLSTRYLVNALEDLAYRCGIGITFQYNNDQAYDKFYAGMTPLLDTMKNVGAIDDYYIHMAADINGLDQVNANTVIGQVYIVVNGVINDIKIDLIALPPQTDLTQFGA